MKRDAANAKVRNGTWPVFRDMGSRKRDTGRWLRAFVVVQEKIEGVKQEV
jgi:hypothetical protein